MPALKNKSLLMDEAERLGTVWEPGGRGSNEKQLDGSELCFRKTETDWSVEIFEGLK